MLRVREIGSKVRMSRIASKLEATNVGGKEMGRVSRLERFLEKTLRQRTVVLASALPNGL